MFAEPVAPSPREISTAELSALLESNHPPLIAEILGPQHFATGHLPGAVNLPLEGFAENALRTMPNTASEIVVYCASATCHNSDIAARKLESLGYQNVRVFKDGKAAWKDAGHSLESEFGATVVAENSPSAG